MVAQDVCQTSEYISGGSRYAMPETPDYSRYAGYWTGGLSTDRVVLPHSALTDLSTFQVAIFSAASFVEFSSSLCWQNPEGQGNMSVHAHPYWDVGEGPQSSSADVECRDRSYGQRDSDAYSLDPQGLKYRQHWPEEGMCSGAYRF